MNHNEQHINSSTITVATLDLTLWKAQTPQFYAPSMIGAESLVWVAPCEIRKFLALPDVNRKITN